MPFFKVLCFWGKMKFFFSWYNKFVSHSSSFFAELLPVFSPIIQTIKSNFLYRLMSGKGYYRTHHCAVFFFKFPVTPFLFGLNILPSILFSDILTLFYFILFNRQTIRNYGMMRTMYITPIVSAFFFKQCYYRKSVLSNDIRCDMSTSLFSNMSKYLRN